MFYAHEGNRTDNAFTTFNGVPTRTFRAFATKKQREHYRNRTWDGGSNNLIDCKRNMVEAFLTRDFGTYRTGDGDSYICARRDEYDRHYYEIAASKF